MAAMFMELIAWLVNGLRIMFASNIGRWIVTALAFIGLQWTTQKVVTAPVLDGIRAHMQASPSGDVGVALIQWLGVLQFDVAITMLLSAYTIRFAAKSAQAFLSKRTA